MARIRTIKPEFFGSKDISSLPRFTARVTFEGIWCQADDEGRLRYDDPRILKGQVWPLDDWHTAADVAQDVACLVEAGLLIHYMVSEDSLSLPGVFNERSYLAVTNWRHQKINRPTPSKLPAPSQGRVVPLTCTEYNSISRSGPTHGGFTEDSHPRARAPEVEVEVEVEQGDELLRSSDADASPPPAADVVAASGPAPVLFAASLPVEEEDDDPEKPITAQTCVRAWVDACRANDVYPSRSQTGQVAKIAKELLTVGNHPERVLTAAESAGAKGYVQLDRELTVMNGKPRPVNGVARPSHTDARVAAGLSLVAEMAREEAARAGAGPREIER